MRTVCPVLVAVVALLPLAGCGGAKPAVAPPAAAEPVIRRDGDAFTVVDAEMLPLLAGKSPENAAEWAPIFAVYVGPEIKSRNQTPLLGAYRLDGTTLRFEPRFPLRPGTTYVAFYDPTQILEASPYPPMTERFVIPKPERPPTEVTHVYPSRDTLPENQLRFYVHFSAPMTRGEAYEHIKLLGADGKAVDHPFLELAEEFWDPKCTRFTLLVDPGRIKRGLKPREELGPSLEQGKNYTLVVEKAWPDAAGDPLKESYRKAFRVTAPQEGQPNPKAWKVQPPEPGAAGRLTVAFPAPLDRALLDNALWVTDDKGQDVPGTVAVSDEETRWHFTPKEPWKVGAYRLVVDADLEDLAGNSVARPFEVDEVRPIERRAVTKTVAVPFRVGAAP